MLRLALAARTRLLRAGAVRAAGALAPGWAHLVARDSPFPFLRCYEASRFLSSDAEDRDGRWKTLAVKNAVAWQEAVKPSLLTFLQLKNHLMVPVAFVVPRGDDAWPRAAWGYPLGKHAAWLRKQWREGGRGIDPTQRKELDEMPFAWDWSQHKWDLFLLPALRRYFELHGHTDVSTDFRIPKESPEWPENLKGYFLGCKVLNIRNRGDFAKQVEADKDELERLHFCHDSTLIDRDWREKVIPALRMFRQEFVHCNVMSTFVVPARSPWPEATWGMRLGSTVQCIRCGDLDASSYKRELDELGFVWDHSEWEWGQRIMPALEVFQRLQGHCRVPASFVVPSEDKWPTQSWGLNLGNVVSGIRGQGYYSTQVSRDKTHLEQLGFVWDFYEAEWSERIMPAFESFHRLHGHCRVSASYVVPSDENWPEQSWGLKLGNVVGGIRTQSTYSTQVSRDKTRLEQLGFAWDFYEAEWNERIMPAFESFYRLHGNCRVPASFVVPSDENWPIQSWGLKLGNVVSGIRGQGYYTTQVSRDKTRLEQLGFVWDFYEAEWNERIMPAFESFHRLHGHCRVSASYVVPPEASWPKEAHGLKLGYVLKNFRKLATYFDQIARAMDSLEAIDFDSRIAVSRWEERVEPLLATFEQLHGHRNVPLDFVVPSVSPWEEKDWGVQLGKLEQRERQGYM